MIHRDIKPENILLHDGSALVADAGGAGQLRVVLVTNFLEELKRKAVEKKPGS